jgi:hypothetical protein
MNKQKKPYRWPKRLMMSLGPFCQRTAWWGQQPSTIVSDQSQLTSDHSWLLWPITQSLLVTCQSPDHQSPLPCLATSYHHSSHSLGPWDSLKLYETLQTWSIHAPPWWQINGLHSMGCFPIGTCSYYFITQLIVYSHTLCREYLRLFSLVFPCKVCRYFT